jgi:hypothetical protein
MNKWTYFVSLDGDFAASYDTLEKAEYARVHERGHIEPEHRTIWRERIVSEQIYPPMSDPRARL